MGASGDPPIHVTDASAVPVTPSSGAGPGDERMVVSNVANGARSAFLAVNQEGMESGAFGWRR